MGRPVGFPVLGVVLLALSSGTYAGPLDDARSAVAARDWAAADPSFRLAVAEAERLDDGGARLVTVLDAWADSFASRTLRLDELAYRERIAELWRAGPRARTLGAVSALHDLASVYLRVGPLERAESVLREALELRESLEDAGPPEVETLLRALDSTLERLRPDDPEREAILLRLVEAAPTTDDLHRLSRYYRARGETERAIEALGRALGREEASASSEYAWPGVLLADLGQEREQLGQLDRAEAAYRRAIDVGERALGARHPQLVRPLTRLGGFLVEAGRYEEALPLLERAMALEVAAWGAEQAVCACACGPTLPESLERTYRALGREDDLRRLAASRPGPGTESADDDDAARVNDLRARGRFHEALEQAELDLALTRGRHGPDAPEVAERLRIVAWQLLLQGRGAEAARHAREAVRILEHDAGTTPARLADVYLLATQAVASTSVRDGEVDELLRKELDVRRSTGQRQRAAILLQQLGTRLPPADRGAEQVGALEQALELWRAMAGDDAPEAVSIRTEIALTHLAQQRFDEAERWIEELLPTASRQSAFRQQRIVEAAERFREKTGRDVGTLRPQRDPA